MWNITTAGDYVLQNNKFAKVLRNAENIHNSPEYKKFFRKVDAASTTSLLIKYDALYFIKFDILI